LTEIDQQRETEAQAARRAQEEKDRRRQEVEAAQRAAEQAARKKAEAEAREKAEEERRRQVAMARQRAEEERSFVFAKRAGTLIALDEFLSAHPAGVFTADARQLTTRLQVRDEDFRRALSGNDAALLKSFIATYGNGTDVRQVRARLRVLEPKKPWITSKWGLVAASALIVLIGGSIFIGFKKGYGPSVTPTAGVIKTAPADLSDRTAPGSPGANPPLAPSVDAAAWSLLKETTDDDALKRFIEQYPQSAFRQDAQARIAELGRERAAKTEAAAKAAVEVATRLEAANQALEAERAKLATQTQQSSNEPSESAIQPNPERAAGRPLSGSALIQAIKMELTRTGCYAGKLDDDWTSSAVKQSIVKFIKAANLPQVPDEPSTEFLGAIRNQPSRLCPLECTKTETESNGKCIAKTCPNGQQLDTDGSCQNAKQHSASRPSRPKAPAETSSSVARGTVATGAVSIRCDKSGCKEHRVVNAPGGLPCKHAFQGRRGGWHCTD